LSDTFEGETFHGENCLHIAILNRNTEMVRFVLETGDPISQLTVQVILVPLAATFQFLLIATLSKVTFGASWYILTVECRTRLPPLGGRLLLQRGAAVPLRWYRVQLRREHGPDRARRGPGAPLRGGPHGGHRRRRQHVLAHGRHPPGTRACTPCDSSFNIDRPRNVCYSLCAFSKFLSIQSENSTYYTSHTHWHHLKPKVLQLSAENVPHTYRLRTFKRLKPYVYLC
jgi:hypothetical protein